MNGRKGRKKMEGRKEHTAVLLLLLPHITYALHQPSAFSYEVKMGGMAAVMVVVVVRKTMVGRWGAGRTYPFRGRAPWPSFYHYHDRCPACP